MSINLQKGQKIDLTKKGDGLNRIMVGLGWDEAQPAPRHNGGGLFGLFKSQPQQQMQNIDCDASAILLNDNGKLYGREVNDYCVYYGNLSHYSGAIQHQGDNLTGAGDGDDEQIVIELNQVPAEYDRIVFVVNIYQAVQRHQHFGMIRNAFIRIVDARNGQELCKFNLSENYNNMTAMIFGEAYRHNGEWKFNAVGQGTTDPALPDLCRRYM